jgi:catechol 2,3-dioxygenase-like lactoylglutathione lyase family enzyme
VFERCSFIAITSTDLARAKRFWAGVLNCPVLEEQVGHHFIVDLAGLRLCVDIEDGAVHVAGSTDPTLGIKVVSVRAALDALIERGLGQNPDIVRSGRGEYAILHDPDGHTLVLADFD